MDVIFCNIESMIKIQLVLWLMLLGFLASGSLTVDSATNTLKDEYNRVRVMHGVNVVFKQFPYYPARDSFNSNNSLVAEDFINLQKWGFNSIRLYIAWEGFQPKRSQYNYSYLAVLRDIVRQAQTYGISVLIDAHHDLYSKRFCGQGFPSWLVDSFSFPAPFKVTLRYDKQGNPLKEDCMKIPFFKYYLTYDVMSFSNDFFKNKNGMNDKFIEMWIKVVQYFKSENNVIGYDIINQPTGGNLWKNPYAFIGPSQNNNKLLLPFYKKISKQIRQIQREKLLLFEPSPADMLGGFFGGFGEEKYKNKDVLNYHTYCPFKNNLGGAKCERYNAWYINHRSKNVKELGVGAIMSQFGSVPNDEAGRKQIASVCKNADKHLTSWYYWQFKYNNDSTCSTNPPWLFSFYYPNGTIQSEKIKTLSYPYAYAICGSILNQTHTESSYVINLIPSKCSENKHTEIFINQEFYFQNKFVLKFTPNCELCRLRMITKGYYELIVDDLLLNKPFSMAIASYMSPFQRLMA